MAIFLLDTFTDTPGTPLESHVGEIGATWTIHPSNPSASALISDANRVRSNLAGAAGNLFYASGTPSGGADYYVETIIRAVSLPGSGYAGVTGRTAPATNDFYFAIYNLGTGDWELWYSAGITANKIGNFTQTLTVGQDYTLRLDMVGSTIRLLVDGVQQISVIDTNVTSAGKAGVIVYGTFSNSTGLQLSSIAAVDPFISGIAEVDEIGLTTATVSATAASGGTGPYTYQWQRSLTSGSGYSNVSGATSLTLNDSGLTRDTAYFYQLISTDSVTASVTSNEVTLTTANSLVVFDGNSLTAGQGATSGQNSDPPTGTIYPAVCLGYLGSKWMARNFGVSGQTTPDMSADAATQTDPLYSASNTRNVVVGWEITNDLFFGASAADAYTNYVTYCQARQAVGWRVPAVTVLPRSEAGTPAGFEADRQTVNANIRANWRSFADSLADIASDSRIGPAGSQTNPTYYGDLVHLTDAGYAIVAQYVAAAIQSAIYPGGSSGGGGTRSFAY